MSRWQFINSAEDMQWLRDVHKVDKDKHCSSAVIHGNEDYPEQIDLYISPDPRYSETPDAIMKPNENGDYVMVGGKLHTG